jgi:hypothetical protein
MNYDEMLNKLYIIDPYLHNECISVLDNLCNVISKINMSENLNNLRQIQSTLDERLIIINDQLHLQKEEFNKMKNLIRMSKNELDKKELEISSIKKKIE